MDDVYDYVKTNDKMTNKVCTEEEYPYHARNQACDQSKCSIDVEVSSTVNIPEGDRDGLLRALSKNTVSIAIDATPFSFYAGGVLNINSQNLNHGVLAVGYELDDPNPYLIVRNSWGERWGLKGYIHVSIAHNGGALIAASYPLFKGQTLKHKLGKCDAGEMPDAAKNCLCTYGESCDKRKPPGQNGCKDDCGCGEFGFCR